MPAGVRQRRLPEDMKTQLCQAFEQGRRCPDGACSSWPIRPLLVVECHLDALWQFVSAKIGCLTLLLVQDLPAMMLMGTVSCAEKLQRSWASCRTTTRPYCACMR